MNTETSEAIFNHCPLGCSSTLEGTSIKLPEGKLKRCSECGQLLSACSKTWFDESMQEFNVPEGTLPSGKNKKRYHHRMGAILKDARNIITRNENTPRLLDVGCSSGALLLIGTGNTDSWTVRLQQGSWEYFDIRSHGGHISFFNLKSIALLAKRCGFVLHDISTKRVNLIERKNASRITCEVAKIACEVLAIPARWTNKGHDMLTVLRKPQQ